MRLTFGYVGGALLNDNAATLLTRFLLSPRFLRVLSSYFGPLFWFFSKHSFHYSSMFGSLALGRYFCFLPCRLMF